MAAAPQRLRYAPLTAETWPAFEALFGPERGGVAGCWCMWWRLTRSAWTAMGRAGRKAAFRREVDAGMPLGVLAFAGNVAVGWCAVGPRATLPGLNRSKVAAAVDERPVWSITCFYIAPGWRRRGLMRGLIDAAVAHVRAQGGQLVEAYPKEPGARIGSGDVFTGIASAFAACGFDEVARRAPKRPVMRRRVRAA